MVSNELKHIPIAKRLCRTYHFKTLDKVIYRYNNSGLYMPDGEAFVEREAQKLLGSNALSHTISEVVNWIKRETYTKLSDFDCNPDVLNGLSGLLNMKTLELQEHTPECLSLIQIPVFYDSRFDAPAISKFLTEILKPEDIDPILELFGYCLLRELPIQKAFLLVGEGANGKSTLIELLRAFLGKNNCSSMSLQELEDDKFKKAELFGKLANLSSDIPSKGIHHIGTFKMLTGGDKITAERKFGHPFQFTNFAKLVFSANRPPKIFNEDTLALWRRFIIIDFPNTFSDDTADKHLLDKLTTEAELAGLLNLSLRGLQRLLANSAFSYAKTVEDIAERYTILSDPILNFVNDQCELDGNATIDKQILYDAFTQYCQDRRISTISKESFGRNLKNSPTLKIGTIRSRSDGSRAYCWLGIKMRENGEDSSFEVKNF
jgi:P4 family phage/plasmid primase-like protien